MYIADNELEKVKHLWVSVPEGLKNREQGTQKTQE
jgi:hypothetical protein